MKKIFAFALALVSIAVSMTSCVDQGLDFIDQNIPHDDRETEYEDFDGKLYFAATGDQLSCINNEYTVRVGDQEIRVNILDLPETWAYPAAVSRAFRCYRSTPSVYVYTIPAGMRGNVSVTCNWSAKYVDYLSIFDAVVGVGTVNDASFNQVCDVNTLMMGSTINWWKGKKLLNATL